jgi:hypothetical protein
VPSRLAALLAVVVLAALAAAGCGSSSDDASTPPEAPVGASARSCETFATDAEGLRATGISCDQARQVMDGWQRQGSCALPGGASRGGCLTRSYNCQATRTDRGTAVSCARTGESVAFVARRG